MGQSDTSGNMQDPLAKLAKPRRPPFVGGPPSSRGVAKANGSAQTPRRSHQVNVRCDGVHILALTAKPAPAAAMSASPLDASKRNCRTGLRKDPRCSIIVMPRIKARRRRIGKSSYGLRVGKLSIVDAESPVARPPFWLPSTIEVARNRRN
jgi:hypothetical protein